MKNSLSFAVLSLVVALTGCEMTELPESAPPADAGVAAEVPPAETPAEPTAPTAASEASAVADDSRPVEATDPIKGRKSREAGGYLGAVGSARFTSEHNIDFAMVKKNLDLFEATNSRYPKSHEEFMQKVIIENQVELPELPEDLEYFYDPGDPAAGLQVRSKQSE